jgi:phosphopantothenoylcysteine decarboxylase/phosphopantothenate--cysteine ligase
MSRFEPKPTATPPDTGRGLRILLLVTGGIAAYKACLVVRQLVDAGCTVRVAMTDAATRFVTPMTFEALSGQAVGTTLWGEGGERPLDHIQWAREADLVLVAPATANFLAKMAHGLADDLPSTLVSAAHSPVMVCPAMNDRMWQNPPNRENLRRLREWGVEVVEPGTGFLACGTVAEGRLAEPEQIVARVLARRIAGPLRGLKVLVTGGGSREPIDRVRFVGNRSSGRMGIALAEAARELGAEVTLLLGPTELEPPARVSTHRFDSVDALQALVREHVTGCAAVAMAAAVSDFRPVDPKAHKLKKDQGVPTLTLEPTVDILAELGTTKGEGQCLIGFALETGRDTDVEQESRRKLQGKNLDLVCGNHADLPGEGFEGPSNRLYLLDRAGLGQWMGPASKAELARAVWERAIELFTVGTNGDSQVEEAS